MKKESYKVIMILLVPKIVNLIMEKEGLDEIHACVEFYNSELYSQLEHEENDLWQLSADELYGIFSGTKTVSAIPA